MSDNTALNLGIGGDTIATDDIGGGVKVQRIKTGWGVDGSLVDVADAAGSRLPVKLGDGLGATSVIAGRVVITGTEAALPTVSARRFSLKALNTNVGIVGVVSSGAAFGTSWPMDPGDMIMNLDLANLNAVHAIAVNSGDVLAYLGQV